MSDIDKNYPRADEEIIWDEVAWASIITNDMVASLSEDELSELVRSLDEAVESICIDLGVNG